MDIYTSPNFLVMCGIITISYKCAKCKRIPLNINIMLIRFIEVLLATGIKMVGITNDKFCDFTLLFIKYMGKCMKTSRLKRVHNEAKLPMHSNAK